MVELFASTGRDFDSSIKFNAPTCEEYCEWFPSRGTEVAFAFDIKQVCFISRDQQAAVGSLLRIEATEKKWSSWSKTWSISWHLHSRIGKNGSYNRAARHIKISCLPRESSLNRSWPWWILPQPIKDINIFKTRFNLLSLTKLEWPQRRRRKGLQIFTCTQKTRTSQQSRITRTVPDHKNPGYQKRNRLRMSPILHPTNFADFALLYKIVCCLAMARQQLYKKIDNSVNFKILYL